MLRGALQLFTGSLAGKLLGVVREGLLAYYFGTSEIVAANRIAQTAVLSPLNLITTDALNGAFLPTQARLLRDAPSAALLLYRVVQRSFLLIGLLFVLLSFLFGSAWVRFLAPGFDAGLLAMTNAMLIAMAVGVPSYLHFNMLSYLDMANSSFTLSSWRSSAQGVFMVVGVVAAYVTGIPPLLGWSFTAAYLALSVFGMIYARRQGYFPADASPSLRGAWPVLRLFLTRLRPLIWLPIIGQLLVVTERIVASDLGPAAIAASDYARLITDTGMLLIATPLGIASLPAFAVMTRAEASARLRTMLEPILLLSLPLALVLVFFARPVVEVVLARGSFGRSSADMTAAILSGLAIGLWAQLTLYFVVKVLNAQYRNWTSVLLMGLAAVTTVALRPVLVSETGGFGIGLAASIGSVLALLVSLQIHRSQGLLVSAVLTSLPGLAVMAALAWWSRAFSPPAQLSLAAVAVALWLGVYLVFPSSGRVLRRTFVALTNVRRGRPEPPDA